MFIPTYDYLSNPLFFLIAPRLEPLNTVYLNTNEITVYDEDREEKLKKEVLKYFDEYRGMYYPQTKNRIGKFCGVIAFSRRYHGVLDELSPDAIVSSSDNSASAKFAKAWAQKRPVPFIVAQPSFFDSGTCADLSSFEYRLKRLLLNRLLSIPLTRNQPLWGNEYPDNHLLLWGGYFKDLFRGLPIYDRITVTGNPVYDTYFTGKKYRDDKSGVLKGLGLPPGRKVVTICLEGMTPPEYRKAAETLNAIYRETAEKRGDLSFIIKVHPRVQLEEHENIYRDLLEENVRVIKDMDLKTLYRATDVQVSSFSCSSFEAVMAGIPIVLVSPENNAAHDDLFQGKIELRAKDSGEFSACLDRALAESYREEFVQKRARYLEEMIGGMDGRAGERMANAIRRIVEEGFA